MSQGSARRKKREGTKKGPKMVKMKRTKQGNHRRVNRIEITWGVPLAVAANVHWPAPFGMPPEDAVSAAKARSGAPRPPGAHCGEHRSGITGAIPLFNRNPSSIRIGMRKRGRKEGRRGDRRK